MIKINPLNLKVPIQARVGKINAQNIIYFAGKRFEWAQADLTPALASDLTAISGTPNTFEWCGKKVELYSENGNVHARNYHD